jgi:uncharacterized protein YydD (DUF2326 family)
VVCQAPVRRRAGVNQISAKLIFESLDDRKKLNLVAVMRKYAALGIQLVVTLIDSDLPNVTDDSEPVFEEDEIVLRLHDEGAEGRLFRMKTW